MYEGGLCFAKLFKLTMPLFFEIYNFLNLKCASLVDASCYSLPVLSTVSVDKNRGSSVRMRADSASQNFLS